MTVVLVDATTLVALGRLGELDLLSTLDGTPAVLPAVEAEVTTEPARTNVRRFRERADVRGPSALPFSPDGPGPSVRDAVRTARELLGEGGYDGDVELVAAVYADVDSEEGSPMGVDFQRESSPDGAVGVVSDDRRVRTVTRGLGATVTGTIGVLVRAVEEGRSSGDEAKTLLRRIDGGGLHMTAELRERARELIEDAAGDGE